MVKLLLVTHGNLSAALKESAGMFFGEEEMALVHTLSLFPDTNAMDLKDNIVKTINDIYSDDGVMIMVDMISGTPSNMTVLAISELMDKKISCIAGVNLPMLIETLSMLSFDSLEAITDEICGIGKMTIVNVREKIGF